MVQPEPHFLAGSPYSGQAEYDSGQALPSQPSYSDGMVSSPGDIFDHMCLWWHTSQRDLFIALIRPIQWTIAYPVGADRPAKRQKKSPYMSA